MPGELEARQVARQRWRLLRQTEAALETPMAVLGLVWAVLLVVDLVRGLPEGLAIAVNAIWALFALDFVLRFALAPSKRLYLRRNALTLVSLVLPALRMLRFARVFRVLRGIRLARVLTSLNRGIRSARKATRRRGFAYVLATTLLVTMVGAAGMYAFERGHAGGGFQSYGDSLWWTAMLLTSVGTEYWPLTPEGRILSLLLSVWSFGLIGYFTALLASFFVQTDAENERRMKGKGGG